MIKLTFCLHRLPGMSREAFQDYWLNNHAPLVARHREVLRIRRYVQLHSATNAFNEVIRASRNAPDMYDGVAELWWDSLDDLTAPPTPESQAAGFALLEDERKFIDLSRSPLWLGEEKTIFG
ncbi:MAG: EthD domain-containing protein [Rhizomicrobium sp.]